MEQALNKPHGEIMVVKQHITELEEEREKLREEVREYRNIVDDMVEGMFRITPAGRSSILTLRLRPYWGMIPGKIFLLV